MLKKQRRPTLASPTLAGSGEWHLHLGLFVLALVGTLALFGFLLREGHAQAVAKATADSANLAKVLERQLDTSLRRLDADLQAMAGRIRPSEMEPQVAAHHRDEWTRYLNSLKVNFFEVTDFYVVDAKGDVLFSSGVSKSINVAERSHFKQLQAEPEAKMVWTDVVTSKSDGRPTIVFARGVRDSAGKFLGIVSALVDLDYLQKTIADLDIGSQGLISIRETKSYKLLLRQPSMPSAVNKASKSSIFDKILQGERQGFERFTSPLDGLVRYTTYLVLTGHPFVVTVALSEEDVLAAWRSQVMISSVIGGVLLLSLGLVLWRLRRAELSRQESMAELVVARDSAEAASRSKGQFLANMSHEIRTPMNAILGMLALLQKTALTARQADYAGKTEGAARALLSLLNDILDFSKVEADKMLLDPQPFRVDQLLRDLSVILAANIGRKDVEVLFDIDPALPRAVVGDVTRLQQVLINLGGNAIKFTERGEVVVSIAVVARSDGEATLEFAVRDSGIGIALENQQQIFSGFTQAEASTTRRFGGTGLGLAICQRLVALMGGELQLDSALGAGSCFHFRLSLAVTEGADDETALNGAVAVPENETAGRGMRVLLVDDNPTARDALQRMAGGLGWRVEAVDSGESALQRLGESPEPFGAIFIDWQMPGLDGWQTCQQIRGRCKAGAMPLLIMVTAHGRDMLSQRSQEEQALVHGFLVKPVTASMLYDAVVDARSDPEALQASRSGSSPSVQRLPGLRLLVVEDNANNQQVARELLEDEGAEVQIAENGLLAVEAVAAADPPFDVVLMDLQMPVMDGYTATTRIRQDLQRLTLPIVAMTANAMATDREACLAAGMNDHVGKPFDLDHLVSVLLRLAGRSAIAAAARPAQESAPALPAAVLTAAEVAGVDIERALARLGGKLKVYGRTMRSFTTDLQGLPEKLDGQLQRGERDEARRELHTLKGVAATVGVTALAKLAGEAEAQFSSVSPAAAEAACVARVGAEIHRAALSLARLCAALEGDPTAATEGVASAAAAALTPADTALLAGLLRTVQDLLQASDLDAADALQTLRTRLPAVAGARFDALEAAVDSLEFETALSHCGEWLLECET